jgi:hypothetical protein
MMPIDQRNCRGNNYFQNVPLHPRRIEFPGRVPGGRTFRLTTRHFYTDYAVLKLQLKILIM